MANEQFNKSVNDQWAVWLRFCIDEFRKKHPDDNRSDTELCKSLMEHYVKSGQVKKKNGKYQVPKIRYSS